MQQKQIYFKSDFKVILDSATGWSVPFKLKFFTNAPSRAFVASHHDGVYENCHLQDDGRLCIGFDNHNLGLGELMLEPTFYLNDECYHDGICDETIPAFKVTATDTDGTEYTIQLSLQGASTLETTGTLPAYYMQGPEGKQGKQGVQGIPGKDGKDGAPGKDGKDGEDGAPGKDGRDGGLIYPSYKVDPHNMHLYSDTDTNRVALSKDKHFTVKF